MIKTEIFQHHDDRLWCLRQFIDGELAGPKVGQKTRESVAAASGESGVSGGPDYPGQRNVLWRPVS